MPPANIAMLAKHATAMRTIIGQVIQKSSYINGKMSITNILILARYGAKIRKTAVFL
jgi:hypothetical protein